VTGGAGFIGRNVARKLGKNGDTVIGIGHGNLSRAEQTAAGFHSWYPLSVNSKNIERMITDHGEPDSIVHAAGVGSVGAAEKAPLKDFHGTVVATAEITDVMRRQLPDTKLIFLSSAAIYGDQNAQRLHETAPRQPASVYGFHKAQCEDICLDAARRWNLDINIVRFFSVYGNGLRKQLFWDISQKILRDAVISLKGNGEETRDFIHINDAVSIITTLLSLRSASPILINGGTGIRTSIRTAAETLITASGTHRDVCFNGEIIRSDPQSLVADVSQLDTLGWEPKVSFAEGMRGYWQWVTLQNSGVMPNSR
tara:strand:+ start:38699 stop:39631 length:933 start_codon:yes stop_codon:yes gene_type:complete